MFICFCFQLVSWMNQKDQIGEFACQGLKILTNFDEQSLIFSSQADCIIHPMVKQIIFINILSQMKPLLANNGLNSKTDQLKNPSNDFSSRILIGSNDRSRGFIKSYSKIIDSK